jgi:hypothetical protein
VQRSRFLRFLQGRIAEPATAEDILQSAYVRALEHDEELRDDGTVECPAKSVPEELIETGILKGPEKQYQLEG